MTEHLLTPDRKLMTAPGTDITEVQPGEPMSSTDAGEGFLTEPKGLRVVPPTPTPA